MVSQRQVKHKNRNYAWGKRLRAFVGWKNGSQFPLNWVLLIPSIINGCDFFILIVCWKKLFQKIKKGLLEAFNRITRIMLQLKSITRAIIKSMQAPLALLSKFKSFYLSSFSDTPRSANNFFDESVANLTINKKKKTLS